ncbi:hypothetical protein EDB19DRAFT_1915233 [Suillus lakei]|nr:hypothetical protein EDB19DRAFT_1915233 [Suillus lakei]
MNSLGELYHSSPEFGVELNIKHIAHCEMAQVVLDQHELPWGTIFGLARGVTHGSNAQSAWKVASIMKEERAVRWNTQSELISRCRTLTFTRVVLSNGCHVDLLRVVLADGSITTFFPHMFFGAGNVFPPSIATSSGESPVTVSVKPTRRSPIRNVCSALVFASLTGRGFGIEHGTAVTSCADEGPGALRGLFCGDLPSAVSSSALSCM